jgi:hypothetical protein
MDTWLTDEKKAWIRKSIREENVGSNGLAPREAEAEFFTSREW